VGEDEAEPGPLACADDLEVVPSARDAVHDARSGRSEPARDRVGEGNGRARHRGILTAGDTITRMSWQGSTFTPDPDDRSDSGQLHCSFCGKPRSAVGHMVCGPTPDIAICDECIALAAEIVAEQSASPPV
jgi:hypothetical protein